MNLLSMERGASACEQAPGFRLGPRQTMIRLLSNVALNFNLRRYETDKMKKYVTTLYYLPVDGKAWARTTGLRPMYRKEIPLSVWHKVRYMVSTASL
jgi:hypothetical protein